MVRLINEQRFVRDNLKRKLASNKDQDIGNFDEHKLFSKRIKEYEDCIRFNKAEVEKLADKYGWSQDFYFLPEKNNFFFKSEKSFFPFMELFFLVISRIKTRIKISSINILGTGIRLELESR